MTTSVFAPRRMATLLAADGMNVSRDPMLVAACIMSLLPFIGLWLGADALDRAGASAGIEGLSFYFVPFALLLPGFLIGWVTGFLLIEDRDDGPLLALDVTPVGKEGFLTYRLAVSGALVAVITAIALQLLPVSATIWLKLLVLVTIPLDAALSAIVLLALSRNKVEGLALTKLINLAAFIPFAAVIPSPFRLAAGIVPTYWLGELLGLAGSSALPPWLALAFLVATHAAAAMLVLTLLRRRAGSDPIAAGFARRAVPARLAGFSWYWAQSVQVKPANSTMSVAHPARFELTTSAFGGQLSELSGSFPKSGRIP
jgi:fluoroquinolone transport system permease protein